MTPRHTVSISMQAAPDKLFSRAAFLASAGTRQEFPVEGVTEVAFVGRSNVGKSSAINALVGRRRLAFAAKAPGRTQTVNFYDLGGAGRLVDLPGYGYARVPMAVRAGWDQLVGGYLAERRSLAGIVVLLDARHPLTPQDERLLGWLLPFGFRQLVLLTKSDKLSRTEATVALKATREKLDPYVEVVMLFSSMSGAGVEPAREHLAEWLHAGNAAAGNKRPPA
jgi:GTP-binding protein